VQQIVPGIFHWTALHEPVGTRVSSYLIEDARAVIDPKVPDEGLDALPVSPSQVLLTSGHHLRDARIFADAFGIPIRASEAAIAHLGDAGGGITPWPAGTPTVAPGITALAVGVLAADEGALHIASGAGALAVADAVRAGSEGLGFFPDRLLGDDPQAVKRGLRAALAGFIDSFSFDALLLAHGEPIATRGGEALRAFVARGEDPDAEAGSRGR
jgi:hypothetical protein